MLKKKACLWPASTELYLQIQHFWPFLLFQHFSILNADKFKRLEQKGQQKEKNKDLKDNAGWCYSNFKNNNELSIVCSAWYHLFLLSIEDCCPNTH